MNENLEYVSNMLMYGVVSSYAIALFAFATSFAASRTDEGSGRRSGNIALSITVLGTVLLGGAVLARAFAAGRVPWGNMYEFTLTATFVVMSTMLFLAYKKQQRWLGVFLVVPALLALMAAVMLFYTQASPLVPALRSYWLLIHVSAAVISSAAFTIGAALTALNVIAVRAEARSGQPADWRDRIAARTPSAEWLDRAAYRVHAFTFPLWTFAIVAGAIWARAAWSRYWGWDPKETWAFVTWIGYAAYLHSRVTVGWKGIKSTTIALVAFGTLIFNFTIVNLFFSGLHTYSGK